MRLIDADALEEGKFHSIENWTPIESASWQRGWNDAIDAIIDNAPTVEKHGHWIPRYDEWLSKRMGEPYRSKEEWYAEECECSVCNGAMVMQEDWKYCPYCGAKMDEVEDE